MKRVGTAMLVMMIAVGAGASTTQASGVPKNQELQLKDLHDKKDLIKNKIDKKEENIKVNESKVKDLLAKIKELDEQTTKKENELKKLGKEIQKQTTEIKKLRDEIIGIELKIKERDGVLRERVVAMQKADTNETYIDVLLGSTSFANFIDRYSAVKTLVQADRQMIKDQESDKGRVESKQGEVEGLLKGLEIKKENWEKELADTNRNKNEKNKLIDELEREQLQALGDMAGLEKEYEEVADMAADVENEIIKYQIALQIQEMEKLLGKYCQTGTGIDKAKFDKRFADAGALTGLGDLIIATAKKYKIDPVLMASVVLHETGNGTSNAVKSYNNPGGIMNYKTDWTTLVRFDTMEDGMNATGSTLSRIINEEGKNTIQKISEVYAPIGADNDPTGLNENWTRVVTSNVKELGGMEKDCELQGGGLMAGKWVMPTTGKMTSQFGWRVHPIFHTKKQHRGMDIANTVGTQVNVVGDGVVSVAGRVGGLGNCIMVTHIVDGRMLTTVYGHLSKIDVKVGDRLKAGDPIGKMGNTGNSTGSHLHLEVHEGHFTATGDSAKNPLRYLTGKF